MRMLAAMLAGLLALGAVAQSVGAEPAAVHLTIVNLEYEGTKIWLPGTIVVKKGTKVTLKLINNVPSDPNQHGFTIPDYKIAAVVTRGANGQFTADRAGSSRSCQLHPAQWRAAVVLR
jgi:FtsP/CotA-like multicopper oxidase with cupredoxin domain